MIVFIQFWIQGFCIGIITTFLIYFILFKIYWFKFKSKGKKYNLKVIKCKSCNNSFYAYDFETTKLCCNCICLEID